MSSPAVLLARVMALRSEPVPESALLVTRMGTEKLVAINWVAEVKPLEAKVRV